MVCFVTLFALAVTAVMGVEVSVSYSKGWEASVHPREGGDGSHGRSRI